MSGPGEALTLNPPVAMTTMRMMTPMTSYSSHTPIVMIHAIFLWRS